MFLVHLLDMCSCVTSIWLFAVVQNILTVLSWPDLARTVVVLSTELGHLSCIVIVLSTVLASLYCVLVSLSIIEMVGARTGGVPLW